MSVSFDGSIHEIFSALSYGATLVLPNTEDPFSHVCDVDSCIFTPSLAATLNPTDYPTFAVSVFSYILERPNYQLTMFH